MIGEVHYRLAIKLNNGKYFHGGIDTTKESQFTKALNKELICFDNLDDAKEVIEKDPRLPKDVECKPVKIKITTLYEEINDDTVKKVDGPDDVLNLYTAEELHEDSMPGELDAMTPEKEIALLNEELNNMRRKYGQLSKELNEANKGYYFTRCVSSGCPYLHPENRNCSRVGGFCTSVSNKNCPMMRNLKDNVKLTRAIEVLKELMMFGTCSENMTEAEKELSKKSWIAAQQFLKSIIEEQDSK